MIKPDTDQMIAMAGMDTHYNESTPLPDANPFTLGDLFHLAGCFRLYADICNPANNWAFLPPSLMITRANWKNLDTLKRKRRPTQP